MDTKKSKGSPSPAARGRGRPRGVTARGQATKGQIFETAVRLVAQKGYEAATLREVAAQVGVTHGLLYRYFPSKQAIVLELYDLLSTRYAERGAALPEGAWPARFLAAVRFSIETLSPHRDALVALAGVLLNARGEGVLSLTTTASRARVQEVFSHAVHGSVDPPEPAVAEPLARVLYLGHLSLLLFWLIDQSPEQRATADLVGMLELVSTWLPVFLATEAGATLLVTLDEILQEALLGQEAGSRPGEP